MGWWRNLARLLGLASGVWTLVAGYSLVTTLWRQLAYGGDAWGPAWGRVGIQAACLGLGLLLVWLCWLGQKAKPPA